MSASPMMDIIYNYDLGATAPADDGGYTAPVTSPDAGATGPAVAPVDDGGYCDPTHAADGATGAVTAPTDDGGYTATHPPDGATAPLDDGGYSTQLDALHDYGLTDHSSSMDYTQVVDYSHLYC